MRIRRIVYESLKLPVKKYKHFIVVFLLAFLSEMLSNIIYSQKIGQWSVVLMIIDSVVTITILGLMMNITYNAAFSKKIKLDFEEHLVEGVKEYIITLYYTILTFLLSTIFIIPTGIYGKLMNIHQYILSMDLNTTFYTIHELSHELPINLQVDLHHSLQVNMLISIFIFILLSSFSFIGKVILYKTDNFPDAFNLHKIWRIVQNIGYFRFFKFIMIIGILTVVLINTVILLEIFFADIILSALLESIVLFVSTYAFYLIIFNG